MADYYFYIGPGNQKPKVWGFAHDLANGNQENFFTFFSVDTDWHDANHNHRIHALSKTLDQNHKDLSLIRSKVLDLGFQELFHFYDDLKMDLLDFSNRLAPSMIGSYIQIYCEHAFSFKTFNERQTMNLIVHDVHQSYGLEDSIVHRARDTFFHEYEKLHEALLAFSEKHYQRINELQNIENLEFSIPKGGLCPIW
jgi:hypothetical protein